MGLFDKVTKGFREALSSIAGSLAGKDQVTKNRFELKWYGEQRRREIERTLERRLVQIGILLTSRLKANVSVPVEHTGSGIIRSKPGEYPRMETGRLKSSIKHQMGGTSSNRFVMIKAKAPYAAKLELQMARKLLSAVYEENEHHIRSILARPGYLSRGGSEMSIK